MCHYCGMLFTSEVGVFLGSLKLFSFPILSVTTIPTHIIYYITSLTLDALVDMEKAMKRDKIEVNDRQVMCVVMSFCLCVVCMCMCHHAYNSIFMLNQ